MPGLASTLSTLDASERARSRRKRGRKRGTVLMEDHRLQAAVTLITEADRHHPDLPAADAVDLEVRAAFHAFPTGDRMQRVLQVCRIMRRMVPSAASHLTDEHLRELWRTRQP